MANYLLLRNNKESGPYSREELLDIGLKAYDLVWVQGKSAAWRYPSEVEELKTFAPAIEEQPFDRFYKKKSEEKSLEIQGDTNGAMALKKAVFVTMPSPKKEIAEAENTIINHGEKSFQRVKTINVTENPVAAEVKYSQPLDEIKDKYIKTLQHRKQKAARKNFLIKNLKRASVFIYVLALGILIGFTLKSKTSKKYIAEQPIKSLQSSASVQTPEQMQIQTSSGNNTSELTTQQQLPLMASNTEEKKELVEKKTILFSVKSNTSKNNSGSLNSEKITTAKKEMSFDQNTPSVEVNSVTGERIKKSRETNDESVSVSQSDISKLVSVQGNDYKRGVFGGIRDLQLTVTNNSKYILDNVVVALQYLKPSEQPLKTENISFQSIAPKGSLTIAIPPSNRGIKVAFKIIKIESKELNNQTAGL
ncbi:MAG: hypothetical protein JST17_00505 [Bacteroidetes bacterium]|nr:hypothetical protein [Bacteroidota bacterium]MBS1931765.1 hypothetical protein [Bacteroidota bacterium]